MTRLHLPQGLKSLSARLLVLTAFFVMLGEVLIFSPSVARFRLAYLESRTASGHLAILALEATPDKMVSQALANELLRHVGARGVVLHKPDDTTLMIDSDMPPRVDATFDLREAGFFGLIRDALMALPRTDDRVLRVLDASPTDPAVTIEVLLEERPMRRAMWIFGRNVLALSVLLSMITAALVYLSLQWLLVRPMRRITEAMIAFRDDPEAANVIVPGRRSDEIGVAQHELAVLQETVRQALRQKARLAALGTAVTKINHDLRNILSTARLMSDSLTLSTAPEVRRVTPSLVAAIDRAVDLCAQTLNFTREGASPLRLRPVGLAALVDEVARGLDLPRPDGTRLDNEVPQDLAATADPDQLYRALMNLVANAIEAGSTWIAVSAEAAPDGVAIEVADDGPGLPPKARDNLFRPFAGSARPGGTGLGLAIAREVLRAHGGDVALVRSTADGSVFRLRLPRGRVAQSSDSTSAFR